MAGTAGPGIVFGLGEVVTTSLGPFTLESGDTIPDLVVAWRHDGPGPDEDASQVLVVHALTGSADAAGDWWEPLIGAGRAIDTTRVGVLCANLLGGCYGTTGPTSINPGTGEPYGATFPRVTTRDQARAQWSLLDRLGIRWLAMAAGGSLGGMVALETALERPMATRALLPIAAPTATGALATAWNHLQLQLIERLGQEGLELARQLAMTTYRSEADFEERFGGRTEADGRKSIISYLDHQGRKLVDRFDAQTYATLVRAMDSHDIGRERGGVRDALALLAAKGTWLVGLGITGDILYTADQVKALVGAARGAGLPSEYRELRSTKGHDGFLAEWDQLGAIVQEILAQTAD